MKLLFAVTFCWFISAIHCVSWANITASELNNLPLSAFASINASELSSIPPESCTGFRSSQIGAIPTEAISGFTAQQLAQLSDACNGFTSGLFAALSPSSIVGLTVDCVSSLPSTALSKATAAQAAAFTSIICGVFSSTQISNLSPMGASGLTMECVANISTDSFGGCTGLASAVVAGLSADGVSGLSATCISMAPSTAFSVVSDTFFAALRPAACSGFGGSQIRNFPPSAAPGLTSACVANFSFDGFSSGCAGFQAGFIGNMTPQAFAAFTSDCIAIMSSTAFSNIKSAQLAAINPATCGGFGGTQVQNFPASAAPGLTAACLASFSYDSFSSGCAGFKSGFIGAIDAQAFAGLTPDCIALMASTAFSKVTADQFTAISPAACNGFGISQVQNFPPSAAPGLTSACVANFSFDGFSSGCAGFQAGFIGNMTPQALAGLTSDCVDLMSSIVFSKITSEQLNAFNPLTCSSFSGSQVQNFPTSAAPGLTAACLSNFTSDLTTSGCYGLTTAFIGNVSATAFAGFTADCIFTTKSQTFLLMNSDQLRNIPDASFSGFFDQLAYVSTTTIESISLTQLTNLSATLGGLTAEHLVIVINKFGLELINQWTVTQTSKYNLLQANAFKLSIPKRVPYMTSWNDVSTNMSTITWLKIALLNEKPQPTFDRTTISQLPSSAVEGLRADHVPLILAAEFSGFTSNQALYFTNDTTSVFTAEQLVQLQPETFGNMSRLGTYGLNPSIISSITAQQIQHLRPDMIEVMRCDQLAAFTEEQLNSFDNNQRLAFRRQSLDNSCGLNLPDVQTPGSNNSPDGLSNGQIALVVLACVLGVAIIAGAIIFFIKRRRADPTRQPLLA